MYHEDMPAYDYSRVADIYDDFCVSSDDIAFFEELGSRTSGPVFELMAGTGRVSLPLIRGGVQLTCVDRFAPMLKVLRHKLEFEDLSAQLVCADVCSLPFLGGFDLVILPFQGFTELVGAYYQRRVFQEAARVLPVGGCFVCTSHNPGFRSTTIDGEWHEIGRFSGAKGSRARTPPSHLRL